MLDLQKDIAYIIDAHANHSRRPDKAVRTWDGATPYAIHPIWCATTILTETALEASVREDGAVTLLYHDILEDTTRPLPDWLSPAQAALVQEMTFASGSEEMLRVWERSPQARLYKLYDTTSNLLDATWMRPQNRLRYKQYGQALMEDTTLHYGALNIHRIASNVIGRVGE